MKRGLRNELIALCALGAFATARRRKTIPSLALAGAGGALWIAGLRQGRESFRNQSVVITGGSRGLGLALAEALALEGARLTLLARDGVELERARAQLRRKFPDVPVLALVTDVTRREDVETALATIEREFGGVDMVINNAGAITVGPYAQMRREDFEAQLELHFYATMNMVNAALPYLRLSPGRRIVNICSIGGRAAVPHLLPYDVSKFALSGYSQGLMAELAPERVSVTTVYPALMRTGSAIQAVFKGDHEKEFNWFATGDQLPFVSAAPARVAKQILNSARARNAELTPSLPAKVQGAAAAFFPEIVAAVLRAVALLLPKGESSAYKTGAQSRSLYDRTRWSAPLRERQKRAEEAFNQEAKSDPGFNMGLKH